MCKTPVQFSRTNQKTGQSSIGGSDRVVPRNVLARCESRGCASDRLVLKGLSDSRAEDCELDSFVDISAATRNALTVIALKR